ncbi:hypothetical protein SLS62_009851 [Diatrype stigma]|uniref:Uncharacterized protein n=1 Tax=Diatrype stigma TaxID=117547 RepID=A0AAN9UCE9_9PEZI
MVAIRISNPLRVLRATRARPTPQTYRAFATTPARFYAQGYGDGEGHPQGEDPQNQPAATKAQTSLEHPGPDPPDVGKGTGAGPTKAAFTENLKKVGSSPEDASAQSGGSRSKEATETGSSPTGGDIASGESQHGGGSGSSSGSAGSTTGGTPKDTSTANAASQGGGEALKGPQGKGTPSPKIHNQSVPGDKQGLNKEQKQEVEQHNKDFEKRYDRGSEAPDDKVDKNYWSGQ